VTAATAAAVDAVCLVSDDDGRDDVDGHCSYGFTPYR
jgi:hypothetical protein